ncbi:MAG: 30S ribosomal protein S9 [Myxococcales bacterium]|nr:30S ribosomal protein S9 [Myxococcales bacterium]
MTQPGLFAATGRRKSAVARVQLVPGTGRVIVNKRPVEVHFPRAILRQHMMEALAAVGQVGSFDITVTVRGGGVAGQAGATRHGIARALEKFDPSLRPVLKKEGLLTRDARVKERKKYGQRGARARFQFSKR